MAYNSITLKPFNIFVKTVTQTKIHVLFAKSIKIVTGKDM